MALKEEKGLCYQWKAKGQCSRGDQCSFRHVQNRQQKPLHPLSHQRQEVDVEKKEPQRQKPVWEVQPTAVQKLLERYLHLPCDCWHPPECQSYQSESGCKFGAECSFPRWKVEEQTNKRPKKGDDKSAVAFVKDVRQLGCVFQDTEPLEFSTILRKITKVLGTIRRVRFTRVALRQANIRENKGPSLNKIQVKSSHQRSPYTVKFEDRSQEETERQERCARGDAWRLAQAYL